MYYNIFRNRHSSSYVTTAISGRDGTSTALFSPSASPTAILLGRRAWPLLRARPPALAYRAPPPSLRTSLVRMSLNAAGSPQEDEQIDSLYPPKDRRARRLWHDLLKFKKSVSKGGNATSIDLPPDSSYMRACAHNFAQRLGMRTEGFAADGSSRAVRVHAPAAEGGAGTSSAAAATSTDEPSKKGGKAAGKRKATDDASSGSRGGDAGSAGGESAAAAKASKTASAPATAEAHATTGEQPSPGQAQVQRSDRPTKKHFVKRLTAFAKSGDAEGARAMLAELTASGAPCSPDIAAVFLHVFCTAEARATAAVADATAANAVAAGVDMVQESLAVFAAARASGCVPEEPAWSGLVKLRSLRGEVSDALAHVDEMVAAGVAPRLRTFAPILSAACAKDDHDLASQITDRIAAAGLSIGVNEHIDLVCLAARGTADAAASEVAGGGLLNVLRPMTADTPVLSESHVASLGRAFGGAASGWKLIEGVTNASGVCSATGVRVRPVELSESERSDLTGQVPRLIGPKGKVAEFAKFLSWVTQQIETHGPFEYVLDGANIGFHGQSKREAAFRKATAADKAAASQAHTKSDGSGSRGGSGGSDGSGAFQHRQIERVLDAVRSVSPGARTLVVLHVSHTVGDSVREEEAKGLVERWRGSGILFTSPAGMNDDWYWLCAAIASGSGCRVISNDEMRDHHFTILRPRTFPMWKERHVTRFDIPHHTAADRDPVLLPPKLYSHVMQESADGVWHLPRESPVADASVASDAPAGGAADVTDRWVCLLPPGWRPAVAVHASAGADW